MAARRSKELTEALIRRLNAACEGAKEAGMCLNSKECVGWCDGVWQVATGERQQTG